MKPIVFKESGMQREFAQLDPRLLRIVEFYSEVAWLLYRDILVVTSIYRNDSSTHSGPKPYRFIDFAILENGGRDGSELLRKIINLAFPYNVDRSHETCPDLDHPGTAPHTHLQVKP